MKRTHVSAGQRWGVTDSDVGATLMPADGSGPTADTRAAILTDATLTTLVKATIGLAYMPLFAGVLVLVYLGVLTGREAGVISWALAVCVLAACSLPLKPRQILENVARRVASPEKTQKQRKSKKDI
jgi:hypothetical protein